MGTETWPKAGKKSSRPGVEVAPQSEKPGDPYHYRCSKGGAETRDRELQSNDYGKKAQKVRPPPSGIAVDPRRTIISGGSPKQPTVTSMDTVKR